MLVACRWWFEPHRRLSLPERGVSADQTASQPQDAQLALIDQTMARRSLTLGFPAVLEQQFAREVLVKRLTMITVAGGAAVVLFAGMLLPDWLMTPEMLYPALVLRLLVFPTLVLGGLVLLHRWRNPMLNEWSVALAGLLAMVLDAIPLILSGTQMAFLRSVEINLVVVFTCALARFWPAVVVALGACLTHAATRWLIPDETGVMGEAISLLLLSSLVFTLYASYHLERDERMAFLLGLREQLLDRALQDEHDRMASLATTDALTGVANRRSFERYLSDTLTRAKHPPRWVTLVMIDIDHFKRYNDHYGHQPGDACLKAVAEAIGQCLRRPVDLVARLGGEEFAVVMPDIDADAAMAASERIRRAVQMLGVSHAASLGAPVVTVSVGVASSPPSSPLSMEALLGRADDALYRAKTEGRNRVVRYLTPELGVVT
jgi:diguanylate cyclase (GGDEF)-like protein